MNLVNPRDYRLIKLVYLKHLYYSSREPKGLLERLDLMESKGLKYFSLNIHNYWSVHYKKKCLIFGIPTVQMQHDSWLLFLCAISVGWTWFRGRTGCHWRAGVKGQQHCIFLQPPLPQLHMRKHLSCGASVHSPSSNVKSHELTQSICMWHYSSFEWNSWLSSPMLSKLEWV